MNAQEPAQKQMDTRSESRISVGEKESYVRSAVDGSPHKIAIIRITDNGGGEHVIVAWRDEDNNLVFDKKILGVAYSKNKNLAVRRFQEKRSTRWQIPRRLTRLRLTFR